MTLYDLLRHTEKSTMVYVYNRANDFLMYDGKAFDLLRNLDHRFLGLAVNYINVHDDEIHVAIDYI